MAAIAPSQSLPSDNSNAGYSKTTRRQYQSCDQCRKSRRACDAGSLRVVNFPFTDEDAIGLPRPSCEACSNCARTGKKCTFEWLRSLPRQGLPKGIKRKLDSNVVAPVPTASERETGREATREQSYSSSSLPVPDAFLPSGPIALEERHTSSHHHHSNGYASAPSTLLPHLPSSDFRQGSPESKHADALPEHHPTASRAVGSSSRRDFPCRQNTSSDFHPPALPGSDSSTSSASYEALSSRKGTALSHTSDSGTSASSDSGPGNGRAKSQKRDQHTGAAYGANRSDESSLGNSARRGSSTSTSLSGKKRQSSSPLMNRGQIRFADGALKAMIASGLLRIYHDSFENSLSCWVTEKNCPYETELAELIAQAGPSTTAEEAALRLGDNRIFSRVSRLDSAFTHLRGRQLSARDNKAATDALNSAIMAFASQWSHSSHNTFWRSKEGLSRMRAWQNNNNNAFLPPGTQPNESTESTDFERMIQKTLWHEARKAIQETTEIDSFKVILAYMLFALTQRPPDENQKPKPESTGDAASSDNGNTNTNPLESVCREYPGSGCPPISTGPAGAETEWDPFQTAELEGLASPPVYLETAVRNLFSWRRKVERYRRKSSACQHDGKPIPKLDLKDQQTFNILFWLGVMCDTTSSAITRRPLVIPDEDCAMIREKLDKLSLSGSQADEPSCTTTSFSSSSSPSCRYDDGTYDSSATAPLWDTYLLTFTPARTHTNPFSLPSPARWPCSFEQAAQILQEAIPVKVLMFRRVAHLQTLAARRASPSSLESTITAALDVYSHWNRTYLPFMADCVSSHNDLPPHVQSWYVILDGHWHYGCLLLADTISQVDAEQRTMQVQRDLRRKYGLLAELRRDNARAVARIAEASLSEHAPVFRNNPDFHFACNGSAILTEPWTDVLVRAMGSACRIFINWINVHQNHHNHHHNDHDPTHRWVRENTNLANLYIQAEYCIQGMALLGRKSDAANYTAGVFWKKLKEVYYSGSGGGGGGGDVDNANFNINTNATYTTNTSILTTTTTTTTTNAYTYTNMSSYSNPLGEFDNVSMKKEMT
ncbi:hypothetical protein PV08_04378 [Exophiala spinifera]|uniref:Zn(2)-C6 fungal-type domain-containing protein n=1 Tax=Exophiala spinifera TaxID=91928 RepID=A0A0D1ZWW7_9EURO|nr:uncharacterized protein PV08_04378 [Exophiala spinifera]KIW17187.1 hypothetical protein PV08_04378 [Exophiala spinifera]